MIFCAILYAINACVYVMILNFDNSGKHDNIQYALIPKFFIIIDNHITDENILD